MKVDETRQAAHGVWAAGDVTGACDDAAAQARAAVGGMIGGAVMDGDSIL